VKAAPRLSIRRPASPEEAAAVAAAIARFSAETAPAAAPEKRRNPWQQAALVEGVSAKAVLEDPEGGLRWQW
jgi:hypothetical protein